MSFSPDGGMGLHRAQEQDNCKIRKICDHHMLGVMHSTCNAGV